MYTPYEWRVVHTTLLAIGWVTLDLSIGKGQRYNFTFHGGAPHLA
jgi:hypothetical protein